MRRYTITLLASTSAGGMVITASASGNIAGKKIALEGDRVFCPACKTEGKIFCVAPRNQEHWNGKQVALENDFCLCQCPVLPKLIPVQNIRYQQLTEASESPSLASHENRSNEPSRNESIVEQYFSLVSANGDIVNNFRYDLLADGVLHTKANPFTNGDTAKIEGNRELEMIAWHSPYEEN